MHKLDLTSSSLLHYQYGFHAVEGDSGAFTINLGATA